MLGLVVAGGVDGEFAEQFAGGGVDDPDVEVVGEQEDAGLGVGSADADVVEAAVDAQGDGAAGVDAVVTDPVVGVGVAAAGWGGFGRVWSAWLGWSGRAGTGGAGAGCRPW